MSQENTGFEVRAASVSDRGLSEKRPLNEDSYLADVERRFFAVADGVGGAQAGEVASQTAMEVLDEAFRHLAPGADVEDLMEIAIQRANSSIHRMSREHPKLAMMATTIVALHVDDNQATIGHVGDSRLYRLTPDGRLHRETLDHSVVEEEVRAGRMTPEQAARHPSRNVISRALGAEETVEVDLKTIRIQDRTSFLLCSDGITRHIGDDEIRELLSRGDWSLDEVCQELKRRCYERGAEDNLTAVVVSVRTSAPTTLDDTMDDERTISIPRPGEATPPVSTNNDFGVGEVTLFQSPSTGQYNVPEPASSPAANFGAPAPNAPAPAPSSTGRSLLAVAAWVLISLLLMAVSGVGGFLAGRRKSDVDTQTTNANIQAPAAAASPPIDRAAQFDVERREVDQNPQLMLKKIQSASPGNPMDSNDPEALYLYGRALLLTGNAKDASEAFKKAAANLSDRSPRDPMRVDSKLAGAVAALKSGNWQAAQTASKELDEVIERDEQSPVSGEVPTPTN